MSAHYTQEIESHAYALDVTGYTVLRGQVDQSELSALRHSSNLALELAASKMRAGQKLAHTFTNDYYIAARAMYCWGDACVRLLEHDNIHALAAKTIGDYQLWDMLVMSSLPAPSEAASTTQWHRDFDGFLFGTASPAYLWFFVCLDDVTPENGATWVVPGSHKRTPAETIKYEPHAGSYPTSLQLCGEAGDILVMNPLLLHTSGHNRTDKPRNLLNIGICHSALSPMMDHWAIAGPSIRSAAGERLRKFLGADRNPLDTTWTALPEGWVTVDNGQGSRA